MEKEFERRFPPGDASRIALEAFRAQHPEIGATRELDTGPPARVERLDREGAYLLVPIRDETGLRAIVQLDAAGLSVESSGVIQDPSTVFLLDESAAVSAAEATLPGELEARKPFLGWRPCRESFDSMRPLWVIPLRDGEAYVTQTGEVVRQLSSGRGG